MSAVPQIDPFTQAHADGMKAVATFLPSLVTPPQPPQPPQQPLPHSDLRDAVRAMSMVNHVEGMSRRMANGLPPEEPKPTPEKQFGNQLDVVHTRAISSAIAEHPETERARLISEAHDQTTKWIGEHNGKVVVHGHIEIAHNLVSAQNLAAKIINQTVDNHDEREQANREAALQFSGDIPAGQGGSKDSKSGKQSSNDNHQTGEASSQRAGGDSGSVAGGGNIAHGATRAVSPVGATDSQSGRVVTHSSDNLPTAQSNATAQTPKFRRMLEAGIEDIKGAKVDGIRPKKDSARAKQKTEAEGKPVNTASDLLAGRIAVDSPEAKQQVVDKLKSAAPVIDESDQFQNGDPDYGFRSHTLQTQVSPDSSAEVQIVPKEIADVDDQTHDTYEQGREAEATGDDASAQEAMADNKDVHDRAMDKFTKRNQGRGDEIAKALESLGIKVAGAPIKLGGHSFLPIQDDNG